jgi:hypothetical protein
MDSFGYIYKVTNLINGRIYIGQRRGTFSPGYLGSGVLISKAVRRYGKRNFKLEVIAFASTRLMLDGLEMKHIFEHRQVFGNEFLYNIADGGKIHTPNGQVHWNKGLKGFNRSIEVKEKISQSMKGKPKSAEHIEKLKKAQTGKRFSHEARKKMSLAKIAFYKNMD